MDPITKLVLVTIALVVLATVPLLVLVRREIKKTYQFFNDLAARYLGRTRKIPISTYFSVSEGVEVKVYALQGSVYYEAPTMLLEDPGVLVIRRFSFLKAISKLHYSPGRQSVAFAEPVDDFYSFQAKNVDFLHDIFSAEIRERLRMEGRVVRLEIKKKKFIASIMLWRFTPKEQELGFQSVDILNTILVRVLQSRLAVSG